MTAGPAVRTASALPRNSPVPMAPPMAIMLIWRSLSLRARPCSTETACPLRSGNATGSAAIIRPKCRQLASSNRGYWPASSGHCTARGLRARLRRNNFVRPHHLVVLMFQDVAVPYVASGMAVEGDDDARDHL